MPGIAPATVGPMVRRRKFPEARLVRLPAGTSDRLTRVVTAYEDVADVIRAAIERELERREAAAARKAGKDGGA